MTTVTINTLNVIACVPIHGRIPLFIHTVRRLLQRNGVARVICVGDNEDECAVARSIDARVEWVNHSNKPLAAKWNAAFYAAKQYDPDAVLFVGSSDWLTDNWVDAGMKALESADMVGRLDFMLLDISRQKGMRMCHWHGYTEVARQNEPIGIGRMLSRDIMRKMNYRPFDHRLDNGLDWSMYQNVLRLNGRVGLITEDTARSLSISTDRWSNKHVFEQHYTQRLPSDIIRDPKPTLAAHFQEAYDIFK